MPLSNAERQARFRKKMEQGELRRITAVLPNPVAIKLDYLAEHWQCSRNQALARMLLETWEREGQPIPGYDDEGNPLRSND